MSQTICGRVPHPLANYWTVAAFGLAALGMILHGDLSVFPAGVGAPGGSTPPAGDPSLPSIVAFIDAGHHDALVIGRHERVAYGAARRFRSYSYRPSGTLNVGLDTNGRRTAFPELAYDSRTGPLVVKTGVALRELSENERSGASATFDVPCATTVLAPDQTGYVYLSTLTPSPYGSFERTEVGLQLNPPRDGGTPRSVQLYSRRETHHGIVATGTGFHLLCDRPVRLQLERVGSMAIAFTAAGAAVPLASHSYTVVERIDGETSLDRCARCRLERVAAIAVPLGNAPFRLGSRMGIESGADKSSRPAIQFESIPGLHGARPSTIPPVRVDVHRSSISIGIDERPAS
jgi:hypothetical protein